MRRMHVGAHPNNNKRERLAQVNGPAQRASEFCKGLARVDFVAIEALVDKTLGLVPDGGEHEARDQGRDDAVQKAAGVENLAQGRIHDKGNRLEYEEEDARNHPIHEGPIDQQINVPEPEAEDRERQTQRHGQL